MRQDPFEHMQRNNPVAPEEAPSAPMGVADRIVGSRATWPGWVIATAAAVAVVVIGGGTMLLMNRADTTVVANTTSSLPAVASSSVASTPLTTVPVATTAPSVTVPAVEPPTPVDAGEVIAYFIIDDPNATGSSQTLVPVARSLAVLSTIVTDLPRTAVEFLLLGPTPGENESIPAITSAVPDGTRLLDLSVSDGVATIDLSSEFAAGSGSFSEIARLDQLIYTLTRFEEIDGVRLKIDGVPVEVFGGHGIVLDDPVIRTEYDLVPAILIESPAYMSVAGGNPLNVSGTANVFEASVSLALTDSDGLIIWKGFTTATCGTGCRGEWAVQIPYSVETAQMGSIIAWEESAQDGSQINVREHPVWLTPLGDSPVETTATTLSPDEYVCSGESVEQTLLEQPELPAEVATLRAAIFAAAVSCDWEALRALQDESFMFSFGGPGDAIATWQELELLDEQPMRYLAGLLNRPFAVQAAGDIDYHVWPSAFATEWSAVSSADREALRPLYDEDDFAGFSDFGGYFGYRIGIVDGTWSYFVAGD